MALVTSASSPDSAPDSAPASGPDCFVARSPEDVVAVVPIVLGFMPEASVVMLTIGAEHQFHARVDLPTTGSERRLCADALLDPVLRHGVSGVVFVLYTPDAEAARGCAMALHRAFTARRVEVVDVVRVDGGHWFEMSPDGRAEGPGQAFDVSRHVFTARAVASGRVTLSSRAELAASVAADQAAVDAVASAGRDIATPDPSTGPAWVLSAIERLVAEHARPDPPTAARLLLGLGVPEVRDAVLGSLDRAGAERAVPLLSALARSAPPHLVGPVAATLAFAAWLSGDGALAWCAIERAEESTEVCSLADQVARALVLAMPPALWSRR